jgi:predicted secreted protein
MQWTSALAIYFLFWNLSLFLVLPFGVRTSDELGEAKVAGQADSAPHRFDWKQVALRTTIVSAVLFGLYYLNYVNRWIGADSLDLFTNLA